MTEFICTTTCFRNSRLYEVGEKMSSSVDAMPHFEPVSKSPEEFISKMRAAKKSKPAAAKKSTE